VFPSVPSQTDALTLDEVVARLAAQENVMGIVLIGSTADHTLTAASDYDLLLILDQLPVPLHVVFTTIDGRLADVIFSDIKFINHILREDDPTADSPATGILMNWLQKGQVVHDRNGQIQAAQAKIKNGTWLLAPDKKAVFQVWRSIHYNYHQTKRMLMSNDPVYEAAVDLRLTYMLTDVWFGYFTIRQLPWEGEKKAVRYWQNHDPGYLTLFQKYLVATERQQRFDIFSQLAQRTLEPIGGLTHTPGTMVTLQGDDWTMTDIESAFDFWHNLLSS
jgi:hypothetical protein